MFRTPIPNVYRCPVCRDVITNSAEELSIHIRRNNCFERMAETSSSNNAENNSTRNTTPNDFTVGDSPDIEMEEAINESNEGN